MLFTTSISIYLACHRQSQVVKIFAWTKHLQAVTDIPLLTQVEMDITYDYDEKKPRASAWRTSSLSEVDDPNRSTDRARQTSSQPSYTSLLQGLHTSEASFDDMVNGMNDEDPFLKEQCDILAKIKQLKAEGIDHEITGHPGTQAPKSSVYQLKQKHCLQDLLNDDFISKQKLALDEFQSPRRTERPVVFSPSNAGLAKSGSLSSQTSIVSPDLSSAPTAPKGQTGKNMQQRNLNRDATQDGAIIQANDNARVPSIGNLKPNIMTEWLNEDLIREQQRILAGFQHNQRSQSAPTTLSSGTSTLGPVPRSPVPVANDDGGTDSKDGWYDPSMPSLQPGTIRLRPVRRDEIKALAKASQECQKWSSTAELGITTESFGGGTYESRQPGEKEEEEEEMMMMMMNVLRGDPGNHPSSRSGSGGSKPPAVVQSNPAKSVKMTMRLLPPADVFSRKVANGVEK